MFLKVSDEEFDCSPGFISNSCEICPKGTYSSQLNSQNCSKCSPGTYSSDIGLTLPNQCLPCPYGTFQSESGKSFCYSCSQASECRFKTITPKLYHSPINIQSIQPDEYDTNKDLADERNTILIFCVISSIILIIISYFFKRTQKRFRYFDIFKERHDRKYDENPFATNYGGLFSIIFFLVSIIFILSPFIYYSIANITETKRLIPSFTLKNTKFIAKLCKMEIKVFDFAGECVVDGKCHEVFYGTYSGTQSELVEGPNCEEVNGDCVITYLFWNVVFNETGYVNLTVIDLQVYTTGIQFSVTISSSLPGPYNESYLSFYIEPPANYVLNGAKPSYIYANLIPTVIFIQLFLTDSSKWQSNVTGYHITYPQSPDIGEYSNDVDLTSFNFFQISVIFQTSHNAFVIERLLNISLLNLLSGILGSVAGILGLIGSLMEISEKKIKFIRKKIDKKKLLKKLADKRMVLTDFQIDKTDNLQVKENDNEQISDLRLFINT